MTHSPWKIPFELNVVFLLLLGFTALFIDRGTSSWVILQITLVLVVCMLVVFGVLIRLQWNPFD